MGLIEKYGTNRESVTLQVSVAPLGVPTREAVTVQTALDIRGLTTALLHDLDELQHDCATQLVLQLKLQIFQLK
eukprot:SAG31_NODE_2902_length_4931_cov_3.338369_3_plen_74_part_00